MEFISSKSKRNFLIAQKKLISFIFDSIPLEIFPDFFANSENMILFIMNLDNKSFYKYLVCLNSHSEVGYYNLAFLKLINEQEILTFLKEYNNKHLESECFILNALLERNILNGLEINLENYRNIKMEYHLKPFNNVVDIMGKLHDIWNLIKDYHLKKHSLSRNEFMYVEENLKDKFEYVKNFYDIK